MKELVDLNLQGIVFDCDGVIAETEDLHRRAYNRIFKEEDLDIYWSMEQYRLELVELGEEKLTRIGGERGIKDPGSFARKLVQKKREVLMEIIKEGLEKKQLTARPGIARLAQEAADSGVKIGAASITNRSAVEAIIEGVLGSQIFSYFEFIATSELVKNQKPAPDVYKVAVDKLGIDAKKSVAVEDTIHGMHSAQAAGLKCIVTPCDHTKDDNFEGADLLVPDLGEPGNNHHVDLNMLNDLVTT